MVGDVNGIVSELEPSSTTVSAEEPLVGANSRLFTDMYDTGIAVGVGGYGHVWSGTQKNLQRRVALKMLRTEVLKSNNRHRIEQVFRQEAITTAYLQHPNVVPVYDLVQGPDDAPVVVMKLMEGQQWHLVLAEDFEKLSPLEFLEKHLAVLISTARAVAFAHSRGIIHRDLKPSQVMLANFSEVLLMDWGLAMAVRDADGQIFCDPEIIVGDHSPLIHPMVPAGTPGYMAPEQEGKDASKLGPWTDVYLLGAILYELLTGWRPGRKTSSAGESSPQALAKPEELCPDRDIPSQLSALALKALSPKPSKRVASASAFANELQDYLYRAGRRSESMTLVTEVATSVLEDEQNYENLQNCLDKLDKAVAVWPENHMAHYMRHQALMTFAYVAMSSGDLRLARLQADRLPLEPERSNMLATIAEAEAAVAKQKAYAESAYIRIREDRERAEGLIKFLLKDLHQELEQVGRKDIIYKVASQALGFFDSLADETNANVLQSRCVAFIQIGDVLSEQARRIEAEGAYIRALELARSLMSEQPDQLVVIQLVSQCLKSLGCLLSIMGRLDEAEKYFLEAVDLYNHGLKYSRGNPELLRCIGRVEHDLSRVKWRSQDYGAAMAHLEKAMLIVQTHHQTHQSSITVQADIASYIESKSAYLREQGKIQEAIAAAYEALANRIAISSQQPTNVSRAEDVYWSRANLGQLQIASGELEEALTNLRPDLTMRRRAFEENPKTVLLAMGLTFQLSLVAEATFLLGNLEDTENLLSECLLHSRELATQDNSNPTVVARLALHLVQMAELKVAQDKWPEAESLAAQALEKGRYANWMATEHGAVLRPLVRVLGLCMRIRQRQNRQAEALELRNEALSILTQIKMDRSTAAFESILARVVFDSQSPAEHDQLVQSLRKKRHLDPYLQAWEQEIAAARKKKTEPKD